MRRTFDFGVIEVGGTGGDAARSMHQWTDIRDIRDIRSLRGRQEDAFDVEGTFDERGFWM